ncbi:hypothetical protein QTP70_000374 [Hemibagrus guttatus]|uniref:Ig-like domain-containing protein n=1 Tax=Hemibagrus guttatus TaxID=175788 RepID=A0AAE0UJG6_9TELE|nr:hypothetical protein QTP70_000374 [Hemibagrus guttatus]
MAVEVARASVSDASGTSPWGGVPGMPHRKEAPGQTQEMLERLCLLAGLGTPRGPSRRDGGTVWGEEDEFKLIGPSGKEEYHHSAVTLSCHLSPEISAVDLEIRWFQETACVCVHKNREVTEGRGYEGRVSLFTQQLDRGIISLQLRDCNWLDEGCYRCQVTDGDRPEEITVEIGGAFSWPSVWIQLLPPPVGPPLQNTSPTMDPAELHEIIVRQGAVICSYQDQVEALQNQLRSASTAAPRDPPAAHGESPRLAMPEKFDGSADRCRGFLRQCEVFFSHQLRIYCEEGPPFYCRY